MATVTPPRSNIAPAPPVDGDTLYEVVDGQVVEKAAMGAYEGELASLLVAYLLPFVKSHKLGKVVGEVLFLIDRDRNLQRRPDVAFVSDAHWPCNRNAPQTAAWDVVPDLAIEVVSPTNMADEIIAKVDEYFRVGVQRVWVVYPKSRAVYIYESPNQVKILQASDTLEGAPLLPGFHLPLALLFEEQAD